ncbi:MAG: hypothetical protein JJT88_05620 [Gammaproteobacteria bacterium]|nr:hypothetical protein [Gammaproteobacteria bacterium]
MDALIPAVLVLDPHSGQPELKHATVSVQRWSVTWQAMVLSTTPLDLDRSHYWDAHPEAGGWTYRMAGTSDSAEACRSLRRRPGRPAGLLQRGSHRSGRLAGVRPTRNDTTL